MPDIPGPPPGLNAAIIAGRPLTPNDITPGTTAPGGTATSPPLDASSLLAPLEGVNTAGAAASGDVNAGRSTGIAASALIAGGANSVATGNTLIQAADAATLAKRQRDDAAVYAAWGTTPGNPSQQIANLSAGILAKEQDLQGRRDSIQKKLDFNFLDNPVQWFLNQLSVPFEQEAMNNELQGRNDDLEVLHQLNLRTQEGVTADAVAAYGVSAEKLSAMAMVAKGEADKTAGEANLRLGQLFLGTASAGLATAVTPFTAAAENYKLGLDTGQFDLATDIQKHQQLISIQTNARAQEQHTVQMDILNLQDKDLNKVTAAKDDLDLRVKKLAAVTGIDVKNYSELLQMSDGKEKTAIMQFLWDPNIQQGMNLGIGPTEALDFANSLKLPLSPGQDLLRQKLTQEQSAYITSLGVMAKQYTPEQLTMMTNNYIKQKVQSEALNVPSTGGYFSPPSLLQSLSLPGIMGTPLAEALAPLAAPSANRDKNIPTQANDVVAAANKLVIDGKMTPAQAADSVSSFYNTIVNTNDATRGYRIFALPSPASSGKYNSTISVGGSYETHNLVNKVEMESYFTRLSIQRLVNPPGMTGVP